MSLRRERLTWHVTGDDIVVLDLERSVYLRVAGSGRLIWDLLAGSCTEGELVTALAERYGIDYDRAAEDVDGFVRDMRDRGLLVDR